MSVRPYVDQPVVDRERALGVAQLVADEFGLTRPTPLRYGMNALFTCGDVVLRVSAATARAERSHALALWLLARGVPTVRPVAGLTRDVDGFAVSGWDRIEPAVTPVDWGAIGRAVRRVHDLPASDVPAGYPIADPAHFPWWDFDAMLDDLSDEIDAAALGGLSAAVVRAGDWKRHVASGAVVCHGDVHPGNVLPSAGGGLLIDWDLLSLANPAWDHAMLTTYANRWGGDAAVHAAFTVGYGEPAVDVDLAVTLGELRNVAATLMRVKAGRTDPAAAVEAERRLCFWRGDESAPVWRAQ